MFPNSYNEYGRYSMQLVPMRQTKEMNSAQLRDELFRRYPQLKPCEGAIRDAHAALLRCFRNGGKLMTAGNGGSAADSDHITGELTKSFLFKRPVDAELASKLKELYGEDGASLSENLEGGLPAIPLTCMNAANTAFANDTDPKSSFAQLVNSIGKKGDVLIAISTSGNSENIVKAIMVAKAKGITSIALTGESGGKCRNLADICICAPEKETFKIQELHLPIYHALCTMVEADIF